jgi:hypothetical protein
MRDYRVNSASIIKLKNNRKIKKTECNVAVGDLLTLEQFALRCLDLLPQETLL